MKKIKGFLLPAVVLIAGVSAAFATTGAKKDTVLETGYYFDSTAPMIKCISTSVQCTNVVGATCTWKDASNVTHNLQRYVNDTSCGINLYKN